MIGAIRTTMLILKMAHLSCPSLIGEFLEANNAVSMPSADSSSSSIGGLSGGMFESGIIGQLTIQSQSLSVLGDYRLDSRGSFLDRKSKSISKYINSDRHNKNSKCEELIKKIKANEAK